MQTLALCCMLLQAMITQAASPEQRPLTITSQQHEYDVAAFSQYLVDASGTLTIEQLLAPRQELEWHPVMGTASSFGFSDSAYWFRFDLIKKNGPEADHFIELHYLLLDEIDIYLLRQGKVIYKANAGDRLPYAARP